MVDARRVVVSNSPNARREATENTMFSRVCRNAGPFFFVTNKSKALARTGSHYYVQKKVADMAMRAIGRRKKS